MDKYEVGTLFPRPDLIPHHDNCFPRIVGNTFDILACFKSPTAKEVKAFRDAFMRLHVKVVNHVPLVAISYLGHTWVWDISINVIGIKDEDANVFFSRGNLVNMFLIDRSTRIVKAIRTISLNEEMENTIKGALREQLKYYATSTDVLNAINVILSKVSTKDIVNTGLTQEFKGR